MADFYHILVLMEEEVRKWENLASDGDGGVGANALMHPNNDELIFHVSNQHHSCSAVDFRINLIISQHLLFLQVKMSL